MKKLTLLCLESLCVLGISISLSSCSFFKKNPTCVEKITITPRMETECSVLTNCDLRALEFAENLEELFRIHAILIDDAILAVFNYADQDVLASLKSSLFENNREIAHQLKLVYHVHMTNRIEQFLNRHVQLSLRYINAIADNQICLAKNIAQQATENGNLFIEFLNVINPFFAYEPERALFAEHLYLQLQLVESHFNDACKLSQELRDQFIEQTQEFARHLTKAIDKQAEREEEISYYRELQNKPKEDYSEVEFDDEEGVGSVIEICPEQKCCQIELEAKKDESQQRVTREIRSLAFELDEEFDVCEPDPLQDVMDAEIEGSEEEEDLPFRVNETFSYPINCLD